MNLPRFFLLVLVPFHCFLLPLSSALSYFSVDTLKVQYVTFIRISEDLMAEVKYYVKTMYSFVYVHLKIRIGVFLFA